MKTFFSAIALYFVLAASSHVTAQVITYTFEDLDGDETFNVLAEITGGSNGLATYNVALSGLDGSSLDPTAFVWNENVLSNLNLAFASTGFQGGLLESNIGTDGYSAANTQFNIAGAIFGVGQVAINSPGTPVVPGNLDIVLGVPALLGQLTLPGANGITDSQLSALLVPTAALFTGTNVLEVELPAGIDTVLQRTVIPEPATLALAGLGLIGVLSTRRRHSL